MDLSNVRNNLENAINYIQACSVSLRTKDGDIPLITSGASKCKDGREVSVYSGDSGKGLITAVAAAVLFANKDLLSIIGLASLTLAASTLQISYCPPKTTEVVKQSVQGFIKKLFFK